MPIKKYAKDVLRKLSDKEREKEKQKQRNGEMIASETDPASYLLRLSRRSGAVYEVCRCLIEMRERQSGLPRIPPGGGEE